MILQTYCPCNYSVMQSDGNSFCWDVVLDNFNIQALRQYILDQKYKKQISWDVFIWYEILEVIDENAFFKST